MKLFSLLFLFAFVLFSCGSNDADSADNHKEGASDNPIVGRWKLQTSKQTKENIDNEVDLKAQPTEVILSIMDGGYFVIYDTFIDPKFNQKGFSRISERSKGQWEYADKKLILHHNFDDSVRIEELIVKTLNKNTLVTKGEGKNSHSQVYKTYEGY